MAGIDYQELYQLQDKILETLFSVEKEFYLTGGTCLHRFYLNDRYSDDLDFFTNQSTRFAYALKNIKAAFGHVYSYQVVVETKNFVRFVIEDILQVDFVNDIPFRHGEPVVNEKDKGDSVFTVTEYSYPIQRSLRKNDEGFAEMRWPENFSARSQDLEPTYHDAGQLYMLSVQALKRSNRFFTAKALPLILDGMEVQDIDTETDWALAELKYRFTREDKL